jgi:hypothetical protein
MPDTVKADIMSRSCSLIRRNLKKFGIDVYRQTADAIIEAEVPYEVVHLVKFLVDFERGGGCAKIASVIQQCY